MDQNTGRDNVHRVMFVISNATQFRDAMARLRLLENAPRDSSSGREQAALELAVSRYLAFNEGSGAKATDE